MDVFSPVLAFPYIGVRPCHASNFVQYLRVILIITFMTSLFLERILLFYYLGGHDSS